MSGRTGFHPINPMPNGGGGGAGRPTHPLNPMPNGRRFQSELVREAAIDGRITVKESRAIAKRYAITGTTDPEQNLKIGQDLKLIAAGNYGAVTISKTALAVLIGASNRPVFF